MPQVFPFSRLFSLKFFACLFFCLLFCLLCAGSHIQSFMFCLSCSAFYVLPFMFCLSCSAKSVSPPVCGHDKSSMCLIYCNEDMQQNFYGHKSLVCQLRNKSTWVAHRPFNQIGNLEFCNHKSHKNLPKFDISSEFKYKKRKTPRNLEESYSLLWDFF